MTQVKLILITSCLLCFMTSGSGSLPWIFSEREMMEPSVVFHTMIVT